MPHGICDGKPETTSKVSKIPKLTSSAHHPSFLHGETWTLRLARENKFPHKSDLSWPLALGLAEPTAFKHNTTCKHAWTEGFVRHCSAPSHSPMHVTIRQTQVCVTQPGVGQERLMTQTACRHAHIHTHTQLKPRNIWSREQTVVVLSAPWSHARYFALEGTRNSINTFTCAHQTHSGHAMPGLTILQPLIRSS